MSDILYPFTIDYHNLLGKGSYSRVYIGYNLITNTTVAIKLINLAINDSKSLRTRTNEEIEILQMINHPNIIKLHDVLY